MSQRIEGSCSLHGGDSQGNCFDCFRFHDRNDPKVTTGKTFFFDVDDTLLFLNKEGHPDAKEIIRNGVTKHVLAHEPHIELMRDAKFRGHKVVVWSAGGAEWAEFVVNWLGIGDLVNHIIGKPDWYVDDQIAGTDRFLPEAIRIYKSHQDGYDHEEMDKSEEKNVRIVTQPARIAIRPSRKGPSLPEGDNP